MLELKLITATPPLKYQVVIKEVVFGELVSEDAEEAYIFIPDIRFNRPHSGNLEGMLEAKAHILKFYCYGSLTE